MDNLKPKTYFALRGFKLNGTDYQAGDPIPNEEIAKIHNLKILMKVKWIDVVEGIEPIDNADPGTGTDGQGGQAQVGSGQENQPPQTGDQDDEAKKQAAAAAAAVQTAQGNPEDAEAQRIAKEAFDAAIAQLKTLSVDKLKDALQEITDMATLHALLEGEERKTAIEAINERIEAINPPKGE